MPDLKKLVQVFHCRAIGSRKPNRLLNEVCPLFLSSSYGVLYLSAIRSPDRNQQFVDLSFVLGRPPPDLSGGWYRRMADGSLELNQGKNGMMLEKIQAFPPQFKQLCTELIELGRKHSESLPCMEPSIILVNFYSHDSDGLYWHRDNSIQEKKSAKKGVPVVSVSIGDSCDFEYKQKDEDPPEKIRLDSGDVLIFGGPSRLIFHSVSKIYADTCPSELKLPKRGRINLTFRSWK